jgi:hypothetical protein
LSAGDLDEGHGVLKKAYWARKHARDPATKERMRYGVENVLAFEGQHTDSREAEGVAGGTAVEEGRRDCCSSVSGSGL